MGFLDYDGFSTFVDGLAEELKKVYAKISHTHTKADITDFPATMPPSAHTHGKSEITDFPTTMPPSAHSHKKADITDFPATMPPSAHTHKKADITDFPAIPSKVSELTNDSGFINGISKSDVVNALGYTPADSASGGTQIIKSTGTFNGLGWTNNGDGFYSQTVSVAGVTATNDVIVSPSLAYLEDYTKMGCFAASQADGSLTFKCIDPEDVDVVVEVLILNI